MTSNYERTEEDKIIEIIDIEGKHNMFEDSDFIPSRHSLYERSGLIPAYDGSMSSSIVWKRPHEIYPHPEYFSDTYGFPLVIQGSLPDESFLGVLMGVAAHSNGDLIEKIIFSRPDDFKKYGVYTCRFYVDGEWIEVITDTRIPCIANEEDSLGVPVYSKSTSRKEMWIQLIEKSYAKAIGSYEALTKVSINDVLIHLTGGSVQELILNEDTIGDASLQEVVWKKLKAMTNQKLIVLARPADKNVSTDDVTGAKTLRDETEGLEGIISNHLYTVVACREIGMNELVMLRCPWVHGSALSEGIDGGKDPFKSDWEGDWSDMSSKWDEYADVLSTIQDDPTIKWRRNKPNGFIWMAFRQFVKIFQSLHCCKLFPSENYNYYCARGEWSNKSAGGPMNTLRDRDEGVKLAMKAEIKSIQNASANIVVDGDTSWFNNPQYVLRCKNGPALVHMSLMLASKNGDSSGNNYHNAGNNNDHNSSQGSNIAAPFLMISIVQQAPFVTESHSSCDDSLLFNVIATEKVDGVIRAKGHEVNLWNFHINGDTNYFIVVHTHKKGFKSGFTLRLFSHDEITLNPVPPKICQVLNGEWTKGSTTDSTGGPISLPVEGTKKTQHNSKWCQNPQYFLRVTEPFGHSDLYIKIVLRRTDRANTHKTPQSQGLIGERAEPMVGFTICKPNIEDEAKKPVKSKGKRLGQPRLDPFGEIICAKPSSLKRMSATDKLHKAVMDSKNANHDDEKLPDRKLTLDPLYFHASTSFSNRNEACMYLPKVPRSWMPDGLIIIPCLTEKGARGTFDLEIYSNGTVDAYHLQEHFSHTLGGEWTDNCAGGSHVCPSFKKNPHFFLDLHVPSKHNNGVGKNGNNIRQVSDDSSVNVRISLAKCGNTWKNMCRLDAVGSMIGFYVYVVTRENGVVEVSHQVHETVFGPMEEVSTEIGFTLEYLSGGSSYMIVPTTFHEGKHGTFVLSVTAGCEFSFTKEA